MNIQDDNELLYAVALANPKFRGAVGGQVLDITWSSSLAKKVVDFFIQPELDGQTFVPKALYAHMAEDYLKSEIQNILNACMEVTQAYREDINNQYTNQMIKCFRKFYQNRVVQDLFKDSNYDPEKIIERISSLNDFSSNTIPLWNMADLDVDKVLEEERGNLSTIPSNFKLIAKANPDDGGYSTGQVCMVCASPGSGKTMFLAHEVVAMMRHNQELDQLLETESDIDEESIEKQKIHVYWLAAGDMTRLDFIRRLTAIYKGSSLSEVSKFTKKYYTEEVKHFLRYLDISVVPAAYVDAYGVKHFVETQLGDKDPNVVIIDYDANLRTSKGDDMYKAGEELYNIATAIARPIGKPGRLVFVASQPKIGYWDADFVPMEAAAESSRKQCVIDMMITIGKSPICLNDHAGIIHIAKNRRGRVGLKDFYKLVDGLIVSIDEAHYSSLKTFRSEGKKNRNVRQEQWIKQM